LLWEGITAISLYLAGANILVLRHPETLKSIKETIGR
jgi:CO dehydrogenase/acetyl-CoA synthase delta subunit